jgi:nitrogen fixation protein FixH
MTAVTKRSPWPYAIIATFVLFAGYIGYMVKQAMGSKVELVSKEYYQEELAHQQRMESVARTANLAEGIRTEVTPETHQLQITLPQEFKGKTLNGTLHFFRPSNPELDFKIPLNADANLQQSVNTRRMQAGLWRLRMSFTVDGQSYYHEKEFTL